ncbi:MAG TPA: hypothetical protein VJ302_22320 [Blastocatellia bacterium]|nr:hypothetical protein [Blastocatellia bacterium]
MSQENSKSEMSPEQKKKIALGVLMGVLALVIGYQFLPSGGSSGGAQVTNNTPTGSPTPKPASTPAPPRPGGTVEPIVSEPLNLASITDRNVSGNSVGRNIFIYPTPTPPPPPKPVPTPTPTPPPPITLFSVNPPGVIARTGDFDLTILGEKIPADGRVYMSGREYVPVAVNFKEIKVKVAADTIRNAGNIGIEVRSQSDIKLYSNQLSLNVAEPPPPPYRYIGLIVKKTGQTIAVLKSQVNDDILNVSKDTRFGQWRVLSISAQRIVVEDTNIKVSHTINFTGE